MGYDYHIAVIMGYLCMCTVQFHTYTREHSPHTSQLYTTYTAGKLTLNYCGLFTLIWA